MPSTSRSWNILDSLLVLFLIGGLTYVWLGFLRPDPFFFEGVAGRGLRMMLLGLKIGLPILGLAIVALYALFRTGRLPFAGVALILCGLLMGALVAYAPASHFYYVRSGSNRLQGYHPYLQLAPRDHAPRPGADEAYRIFALGGSTTEWRDTTGRDWESRVEEALGAAGKNVQVYNEGREWYTTLHTLLNYQVNLRHHRPHAIVVMHAINDLLHNADFSYFSGGEFREDYGHFYGPVSRLVKRQSLFGMIGDKLSSAWYHEPRRVISTERFAGLAVFRRNLTTLAELARLDGTRVFFMTEPFLFKKEMTREERESLYMLNKEAIGSGEQWDLATALAGMEQYNEAIRQVAASQEAVLIDLEKSVPKTLEYFNDDVHYKDKAYPIIAGTVADALIGFLP